MDELAALLVVRRRRRRRQGQRELRVTEREVVVLHRDDVREVRLGLQSRHDLERLRALVPERQALLHAGADEALARDRDGIAG